MHSSPPTVIVAHQDPASAAAIALVLRELPIHARASTDGRRVLSAAQAGTLDLVVLAYAHTTPALELAERIRALSLPHPPRLLWLAGTSVRRVDLRAVDAVVWRPFQSDELVRRVSQLLGLASRGGALRAHALS